MYNTLEQILPSEIAMKVLTYSRHPIAEMIIPHIEKHEQAIITWKTWIAQHNMTDYEIVSPFAHFFHTQKKETRGLK